MMTIHQLTTRSRIGAQFPVSVRSTRGVESNCSRGRRRRWDSDTDERVELFADDERECDWSTLTMFEC